MPAALEGRDILGVAQTGTGKTAAFALPLLNHLALGNPKTVAKRPQALILAPTRELAMQIGDSFDTYGKNLDLSHVLIYGGVGQGRQVAALQAGVHILVATPGRLIDLIQQEQIFLNRLQGNLTQNQRTRVLDRFREDKVQILVATDLAARGLDVEGLTHVYNFELPPEPETYVHRIGRTGRAGMRGIAITLCCPEEKDRLQEIERLIGFQILEDGREPEPLTAAQVEEQIQEEAGRKNRRRRRTRTKHSQRGESAAEVVEEEKKRPTAADRKAARNKRHRKANKDAE
ncbi:UNVERIFIED_CONTAM: hypothetical protein GTU68_012831 [Idotea baltica]|nr:hypothetical protein [Idotea baltica]